jgi:hypothetical protein
MHIPIESIENSLSYINILFLECSLIETEKKLHSIKSLPSLSILFEHNLHRRINEHKVKVKRIDHKSFIEQHLFIKNLQKVKSSNQSNEKLNFLLQIHRVDKTIVSGNNRFQYNYR